MNYIEVPSAILPCSLSVEAQFESTIPNANQPSSNDSVTDDMNFDSSSEENFKTDPDFVVESIKIPTDENVIKFSQPGLNNLVRSLELSKEKAEFLSSRLKERNMVESSVKITYYRKREECFNELVTQSGPLTYCNNIPALFSKLGRELIVNEWRLFMDSSKSGLKIVLLNNGNQCPSILIGYSASMNESHESLKFALTKIDYYRFNWLFVGDFKMISLALGMQTGNVRYPCPFCLFPMQDRRNHFNSSIEYPERTEITINKHNVINERCFFR